MRSGGDSAMTEAEWLAASDPAPMLEFLRDKMSKRKLRLFVDGCARSVWDQMPVGPMREAVEIGEQLADGLATEEDRRRICDVLYKMPVDHPADDWFANRTFNQLSPFFAALTIVGKIDSAMKLANRPSWQGAKIYIRAR